MKKKLKHMRLKKIVDAKEIMTKTCFTDSVLSLRESNDFAKVGQRTGVDAKIQRNLEQRIAFKLRKKYGLAPKINWFG